MADPKTSAHEDESKRNPAATSEGTPEDKTEWVDPEVRTLDVSETASRPGVGTDGGSFADCTLS